MTSLFRKSLIYFFPDPYQDFEQIGRFVRIFTPKMISKPPNPFMHNFKKMAKCTLKILRCSHARFLKYVWQFFKILHERVKGLPGT